MPSLSFPLFLLPIADSTVFGQVVGEYWQYVGDTDTRVRTILTDWARKQAREDTGLYGPEIEKAKLKTITVPLRIAYPGRKGAYPLERRLGLRVAAVYGENPDAGYWKCYLPLLEREFYYYAPEQLNDLIGHFTRERLEGQTPELVHRFIMHGEPSLDEIRVRAPGSHARKRAPPGAPAPSKTLRRAAEELPHRRRVRQLRLTPEVPWERAPLVERLTGALTATMSNLLLVGDDGVGKTTVWLEVIRQVDRATRNSERPRRFFRTSAQRLIADATYLGEWQETCEEVAAELHRIGGVLWVTDPVNLLQAGGDGAQDSVAAFLLPLIQAGKLCLIGEMTPREVDASRRLLPGFVESFTLIEVDELDEAQMRRVLSHFARFAETNLRLTFDDRALSRTFELLKRHLPAEKFPGKAMRFLHDVARSSRREKRTRVDSTHVLEAFSKRTGLPPALIDDAELLQLDTVQRFFQARIVGQDASLERLVRVVATYKAGLNDPDRPIATLLLCGPTGVGKTAAARALSDFLFSTGSSKQAQSHAAGTQGTQTRDPLFRLDMSEFQHPVQIARLIGHGPTEPGKLSEHIRSHPFSVLLLDEIEKAHPSFLDVLLTVLDEGRLTDVLGRTTDFRNTVVAMTSNLGAAGSRPVGFSHAAPDTDRDAIRRFFRPEFFNRLDQVIVFDALGPTAIREIARSELGQLEQREGLAARGIGLSFSDALIDHISEIGFSAKYGARPLQRAIEQQVVAGLSRTLLELDAPRPTHLHVDFVDGVIRINDAGGRPSKSLPETHNGA